MYRVLFIAVLLPLTLHTNFVQARRGEQTVAMKLEFTTTYALQFKETILPPGNYSVSIVDSDFVFAHTKTMLVALRTHTTSSSNKNYYHIPEIKTARVKSFFYISLYTRDQIISAKAKILKNWKPQQSSKAKEIAAGNKQETKLQLRKTPKQVDYKTASQKAIDRLLNSVIHCEDLAIRRRAQNDDERFERCLCPQTSRWRLPIPSEKLIRRDVLFPRKRHGFSLLINSKGHVQDCRVWSRKPPAIVFEETDVNKAK